MEEVDAIKSLSITLTKDGRLYSRDQDKTGYRNTGNGKAQ